MKNKLEFTDMDFRNKDTYPKENGYYLVKYFDPDEGNLPAYTVAYFKLGDFYYHEDCLPAASFTNLQMPVFAYMLLPNLRSKDGKYGQEEG